MKSRNMSGFSTLVSLTEYSAPDMVLTEEGLSSGMDSKD
jgi:hypothetical protein